MAPIYLALVALGLAAASGAVVAITRAASPQGGVARQVTLAVLALLLLAVAVGTGLLIWAIHQFTTTLTF